MTETLSSDAALRKAQREVEEYHRFRRLSQELLEVNEQICRLRPILEEESAGEKKKRRKRSAKRWHAKESTSYRSFSRASARAGVSIWKPSRRPCVRPCTGPAPQH